MSRASTAYGHLPTQTETDRLVLRQWNAEDVESLWALQAQPEMMAFFDDGATYAREQSETWLRWHQGLWAGDGFSLWAASLKNGDFVGWIGLTRIFEPLDLAGEVEVGWFIDPAVQGQGLATEGARRSLELGFETLGLDRIVSRCHSENLASETIMKKAGMSFVRKFRRPTDPPSEATLYEKVAPG